MREGMAFLEQAAAGWLAASGRACWEGGLAIALVWLVCRLPVLPAWAKCWFWRLAYLKLLVAMVGLFPIEVPILPASVSGALPTAALAQAIPAVGVTVLPWSRLLFGLWAMAIGIGIARLMLGCAESRRLRSAWTPVQDPWLWRCAGELCYRLRLRRVPWLAVSGASRPAVVGLTRPVVALPEWLPERCTPAEQRLILAHEISHVKRGDLRWRWLAAAVRALFCYHPLVWLAEREWRLAQEMACDEMALRATEAPPADYGIALLKTATAGRWPAGTFAAASVDSYHTLARRLEAMSRLDPRTPARPGWWVVLLLLGVVAVLPWRAVARESRDEIEYAYAVVDEIAADLTIKILDAEPTLVAQPCLRVDQGTCASCHRDTAQRPLAAIYDHFAVDACKGTTLAKAEGQACVSCHRTSTTVKHVSLRPPQVWAIDTARAGKDQQVVLELTDGKELKHASHARVQFRTATRAVAGAKMVDLDRDGWYDLYFDNSASLNARRRGQDTASYQLLRRWIAGDRLLRKHDSR